MNERKDDLDDEEIDSNGRWVGGVFVLAALASIALIVIALLV